MVLFVLLCRVVSYVDYIVLLLTYACMYMYVYVHVHVYVYIACLYICIVIDGCVRVCIIYIYIYIDIVSWRQPKSSERKTRDCSSGLRAQAIQGLRFRV